MTRHVCSAPRVHVLVGVVDGHIPNRAMSMVERRKETKTRNVKADFAQQTSSVSINGNVNTNANTKHTNPCVVVGNAQLGAFLGSEPLHCWVFLPILPFGKDFTIPGSVAFLVAVTKVKFVAVRVRHGPRERLHNRDCPVPIVQQGQAPSEIGENNDNKQLVGDRSPTMAVQNR